MKVAIHNGNGWNIEWIDYCKKNSLDFLIVDCYQSNIIQTFLENGITHFLWHFHHANYRDKLMAQNVLFSAEKLGIKVYPNFSTCWYFDDKISEKYILEAINAPIAPTHVFYEKESALTFLKTAKYPLVFKLRGGAGGSNVKLVKHFSVGRRYVNRSFGKGFSQYNPINSLKERIQKFKIGKAKYYDILKGIIRIVYSTEFSKLFSREKGYVLMQEFIPNKGCDYRLELVGDKCWGEVRGVRKNDFRASGSGYYMQDPHQIPIWLVKLGFELKVKLDAQSMSFDFIIDDSGKAWVIEMSYAFGFVEGDGEFFWDKDLLLHHKKINAAHLIIEDLITQTKA